MAAVMLEFSHRYASGFELEARFAFDGGVLAIFGPSGSGKSTILRVLAGVMRPRAGRISLFGREVLDTARGLSEPPERRGIGLLTQDALLFPHLTVRGNMLYGARRRPARRIEFDRLAQVLEVSALLERYPSGLSGGEAQRVALARAILRGPELLLLDEPFTGLDEPLKQRILAYLERALQEWKIPAVYVSHDQLDVRRLASEVLVLQAGRVVARGPTVAALDAALLAGRGENDAPLNLLRVDGVRRVGDAWEGAVGGQVCVVAPPPSTADGASDIGVVWVRFAPHAVTLCRAVPVGLSARNSLRALVTEVVETRGRVFVRVDLGQTVWAEVTPAAAKELRLSPGQEVFCLVKSSALRPMAWPGDECGR